MDYYNKPYHLWCHTYKTTYNTLGLFYHSPTHNRHCKIPDLCIFFLISNEIFLAEKSLKHKGSLF
jgi:hypothetical protein